MAAVKIFTMTHKLFQVPPDPTYVPLLAGAAERVGEYPGYLRDDTGDQISVLNKYYGELTGVYWVWKNVTEAEADIVGICHYRRYPVNEKNIAMSAKEYEEILTGGEYDILTSKCLVLPNSYYYGYKNNHHIADLETVLGVIRDIYPSDHSFCEELVRGERTYFGNICAAGKEIFDEYCRWLFPIFEETHKRIGKRLDGYDDYHKRVYGFISEILLLAYVRKRGLRPYECRIGMLSEKKETSELKEKLAAYFKEHNTDGAKDYFTEVLKKRPDVMMEASDLDASLKLFMELISVCEYERAAGGSQAETGRDLSKEAAGGKCILDVMDDPDKLLTYMKAVNYLVIKDLAGKEGKPVPRMHLHNNMECMIGDETDLKLLENYPVSPACLEVARRICAEILQ